MEEVSLGDGLSLALTALLGDRLALLAGAGLSMAPPSSLPSAKTIARSAKAKYDAMFGMTRPPLPNPIEEQAEFFFRRGELMSVYFRTLIDQNAFAGPPNLGHLAVADLLLVRAIQMGVTTNVDPLIETAGLLLFGQVGVGIDVGTVAALLPNTSPLLKIHGCRVIDQPNMVWAPGQVSAPPVQTRLADSAQWLQANLLGRDLLVVGYWTDWDYLNDVIEKAVGTVTPTRVLVVDPAATTSFATKASTLFALGNRAAGGFKHVRASGDDFLDRLRLEFSRAFLRVLLHTAAAEFKAIKGNEPDAAWMEPPDLDNDSLWRVRRDLEGRKPREPAKDRQPPPETLLGLTVLQLRARGAVAEGSYWRLGGTRIRVLRTANKFLHEVEAEFERDTPPATAPDIVIAVGAETQGLPSSIVRGGTSPTIVRGNVGRWLTRPDAVTELGL